MKLLRLTTRETNGLFDTSFNDQLVIPPNSKIALQSLSMDIEPLEITINSQNDGITYQFADNNTRIISLDSVTYDSTNHKDLRTNIAQKMNQALYYIVGESKKVFGMEWSCSANTQQQVTIEYKIGQTTIGQIGASTGDPGTWRINQAADADLIRRTNTGFPNTWERLDNSVISPVIGNITNAIFMGYLAKGNAYLRARIGVLDDATDSDGYTIGFTKFTPITGSAISSASMYRAIKVYVEAGVRKYSIIADGVEELKTDVPGYFGVNSVQNDYQEVYVNGNMIGINIYTDAGGETPISFSQFPYEGERFELYPFLLINGGKDTCKVNSVKLTPSPYSPITERVNNFLIEHSPNPLTAPPKQPNYPFSSTNNYIYFESAMLATFLGYNTQRQPQNGFQFAAEPSFAAERAFNIKTEADAYLIELMNINIDSYDSFSKELFPSGGQRKNLLSVIPSSNDNGNLVYFPPYPTFIDLLNKESLYLRNIKARVLNMDYSEISARGLSSMVLLIQ